MALKADDDGFLVGDPITIDRGDFGRAMQIWKTLQKDVGDIRKALAGDIVKAINKQERSKSPNQSGSLTTGRAKVATPARGPDGRFLPKQSVAVPGGAARPRGADSEVVKSRFADAKPSPVIRARISDGDIALPERGPNGRFRSASVNAEQSQSSEIADVGRLVVSDADVVSVLPSRIQESDVALPSRSSNGRFQAGQPAANSKPDEAPKDDPADESKDPSAARKLAGDMADSVKTGVSEAMSGVDQVDPAIAAAKEVGGMVGPLLKPIGSLFKGLMGNGEDKEHKERKAWYKRIFGELRELNEKPVGGGGNLRLSGLSGLLLKLPGISIIGFVLTKMAGLLRPVGSLLGRVAPLLGKLSLPLAGMFSAFKSLNTTTEEYAARMGVELNGSLAQELGVRFVGVLGDLGNTLTFGLAGKFGELIAPAVTDAIIGTTDFIKEKWGNAAEWFTNTWSGITEKVTRWIDNLTGLVDKTIGAAKGAKDRVVGAVQGAAVTSQEWVADKIDQAKGVVGGGSKGNKNALIQQMDAAGITDPTERAMFMAQMDHESGGFRQMEESLNYKADGLMKTFPKYYKSAADAQRDVGNPQAIANRVYGGRLGNSESGDGYKYRGRGMIQLTGKANYEEAGAALGLDLANNPDLVSDPAIAAKVATWYWQSKGVGDAARRGDVSGATRKINGGLNGLSDRQSKYRNYLAAGPITATLPARSSAAPSIDRLTPAPLAAAPTQIGSNDKGGNAPSFTIPMAIGQNMGDRAIAHVATGGMASSMGN